MLKRSTFGLAKTTLSRSLFDTGGGRSLKNLPLPASATLLFPLPEHPISLECGTAVKTGELLTVGAAPSETLLSTVTGTVSAVEQQTGYLGQEYAALSVEVSEEDTWDETLQGALSASGPEEVLRMLCALPGAASITALMSGADRRPLDLILISGVDQDPLCATNRMVVRTEPQELARGAELLQELWPQATICLIAADGAAEMAEQTGLMVRHLVPAYPNVLPRLILKNLFDREIPAGQTLEAAGVAFLSAETVAWLAAAVESGRPPVRKTVAVLAGAGPPSHVQVRIGTPVDDVLQALGVAVRPGERLILGGPLNGRAVFSGKTPVLADTTSIMVQEADRILPVSDAHCVNCGECVRACPANVPVNMLVRVLENGLYEDAEHEYDLLSCIDCGLCGLVCIARIPILHYIALGKVEVARLHRAEEPDAQ